jgi:hypothetical protein
MPAKKPDNMASSRSRTSASLICTLNGTTKTAASSSVRRIASESERVRAMEGAAARTIRLTYSSGWGSCDTGKNAIGSNGSRRPVYLVFGTRPTIWKVRWGAAGDPGSSKVNPTGLRVPSSLRANNSLTTATSGDPCESAIEKSLPAMTLLPMVRKKPGLTTLKYAWV